MHASLIAGQQSRVLLADRAGRRGQPVGKTLCLHRTELQQRNVVQRSLPGIVPRNAEVLLQLMGQQLQGTAGVADFRERPQTALDPPADPQMFLDLLLESLLQGVPFNCLIVDGNPRPISQPPYPATRLATPVPGNQRPEAFTLRAAQADVQLLRKTVEGHEALQPAQPSRHKQQRRYARTRIGQRATGADDAAARQRPTRVRRPQADRGDLGLTGHTHVRQSLWQHIKHPRQFLLIDQPELMLHLRLVQKSLAAPPEQLV